MKTIKINFSKLKVEVAIDKFQEMDMRHGIGNALHVGAMTVPVADLAREIYHSKGEVEIPQDCIQPMMQILERNYTLIVISAIKREIDNQLKSGEE